MAHCVPRPHRPPNLGRGASPAVSEKSEDFAPFAGILLPVLCSSHRGSPAARPKARRAPSLGHRQPRRCSEPLVLRSEPRAGLRAPTARAPRRPFRAGRALPPPFPQDSSQGFRCPMEARTLVRCSVRCSTSSLGNWLPRSQFWEPFPSWPPGTVSHRDWTRSGHQGASWVRRAGER